jgi:large subunit ribosomal protein MRP49
MADTEVQSTFLLSLNCILSLSIPLRTFWRQILPRLAYHNPSIPITVTRTKDQSSPAVLKIHTSAPTTPTIEFEITHKSEVDILSEFMQAVGGAKEIRPTKEELETLEELEVAREKARVHAEMGKRMEAQKRKRREMLEAASQGAL